MGELELQTDDGVALAGETAGEGIPVVLLHGLTATRRYVVMGSKQLERSGHRVIAYDARGHGASAHAPEPDGYGYARLAEDLLWLLDAEEIDRAVLVGASMGGHTLLRLALDSPSRVAAIAVVTPAFEPGDEADPKRLERWDALAKGLRDGGVDGFLAAYGEPPVDERWRESVQTVLRRRLGAHGHPDAVADALEAVPRSVPFGSWEELGGLDVPAVVVASRDGPDPEHPLAVGERYAEAIAGARLLTEDDGAAPLAWQGSQLSRIIAELAERAEV